MNVKNEKLAAIIFHTAAQFFLQDDIKGTAIITVTGVDLSANGRHANVWVGVINTDLDEFAKRLTSLSGLLKRYISENSALNHSPGISIKLDQSQLQTQKVYKILED